jgi:microcystin-dependent protein
MFMDGYYGQILLFPTNWLPERWTPCDGRTLVVKDNPALGAVLGYRQDDEYFYLPKLDSPHSELQYIICHEGTFPARS